MTGPVPDQPSPDVVALEPLIAPTDNIQPKMDFIKAHYIRQLLENAARLGYILGDDPDLVQARAVATKLFDKKYLAQL